MTESYVLLSKTKQNVNLRKCSKCSVVDIFFIPHEILIIYSLMQQLDNNYSNLSDKNKRKLTRSYLVWHIPTWIRKELPSTLIWKHWTPLSQKTMVAKSFSITASYLFLSHNLASKNVNVFFSLSLSTKILPQVDSTTRWQYIKFSCLKCRKESTWMTALFSDQPRRVCTKQVRCTKWTSSIAAEKCY